MVKVNLSTAEQREARGLEKKIRSAMNALLKTGGQVSLNYMTPPSSSKVKSAIVKRLKGSLEISFTQEGVLLKDIRVAIKKPH